MEIAIKLNEYELTKVLVDGTLLALSQSVASRKKENLDAIDDNTKGTEAKNAPESDKTTTKGTTAPKTEKKPPADKPAAQTAATKCPLCGENQFDSPSGLTCPNGHGGVESTDQETPQADDAAEQTQPTLEQVRAVLAELTKAGKNDDIKALFTRYGAKKLTEVKKEDYAALLQEAGKL